MKNKYSLFLFLQLIAINVLAQQNESIQRFLNTPELEHASVGFCVKDYSGKVLLNHNMDKSFTPASILKVVTTASAFEVLGSDYKYKTTLSKDLENPNRILIHGYGDPTIGSEWTNTHRHIFIETWANAILKELGGKDNIDIMVIDNYFGYRGVSRKWIHEDLGNYFAAASYGISAFDNTYQLVLNTEDTNQAAKITATIPVMDKIKFTNTLTFNTTGKDNGYILGAPFSNERTIIGDIPANRKKFVIKGDIPNPGLFLGEALAKGLAIKNIKVNNINTSFEDYHNEMYSKDQTKYNEAVFYTHLSPTLTEIARVVNERSNNHYAEHLLRTIGRTKNSDIYSLALEEGVEKINELWKSKGINSDALFMYDGSGLAPTNAVSPTFMTDVLIYMQTKSKNATPFLQSLPLAGKEGTVKNFLKGTRLEGKVYVKSGSIGDVQCFAGYYIDGEEKKAFTIMVNKFNGTHRQTIAAITKLLLDVL